LNERDNDLLLQIQQFFGGIGKINYNNSSKALIYRVYKKDDLLNVIIPHFMNYPLLSQKSTDFKLFVRILHLINEGAHLNEIGLQEIVNINASLNRGISNFVKSQFSHIQPVLRENVKISTISNPNWIAGFVSGEGNFDAGIRKATDTRKERVYLRFRVTQHSRDIQLMELLIKYLEAGRIEWDKRNESSAVSVVVGNFSDITNKIIPFFNKYIIYGIKYYDYLDWVKIAEFIRLSKNKTPEGMEEIKRIETRMNKGRK